MHGKRCRQAGGTLRGYLLAFPYLSFRLFRFTLSQPFPELPLTFFTFVVGEDVRENAPAMCSISCCGMPELLMSFFLRPKLVVPSGSI